MLAASLSSTTMLQRSRTAVLPVEYYSEHNDKLYNNTTPTEVADRLMWALPTSVFRQLSMNGIRAPAEEEEPERFDALEKAGFRVERFPDLLHFLVERFGGHYMNVGASQKIADGQVTFSTF